MRATLAVVFLLSGILSASAVAGGTVGRATDKRPPLRVPARLAQTLARQGYPVHQACGSLLEPPPPVHAKAPHIILRGRSVPACWLVIYKSGYSVSITPHSSRAAAKLAYQRTYNRWARDTRRVAIGPLLVSGFRLPEADWKIILRTVSAATR